MQLLSPGKVVLIVIWSAVAFVVGSRAFLQHHYSNCSDEDTAFITCSTGATCGKADAAKVQLPVAWTSLVRVIEQDPANLDERNTDAESREKEQSRSTHSVTISSDWEIDGPHDVRRSSSFPSNHIAAVSSTWPNDGDVERWPSNHEKTVSSEWPMAHAKSVSTSWGPSHFLDSSRTYSSPPRHAFFTSSSWPANHIHDISVLPAPQPHHDRVSGEEPPNPDWLPNHWPPISSSWSHYRIVSRAWPTNHYSSVSEQHPARHQVDITRSWPPQHVYPLSSGWPKPAPAWPASHLASVSRQWEDPLAPIDGAADRRMPLP